jgi:hypothetical protein
MKEIDKFREDLEILFEKYNINEYVSLVKIDKNPTILWGKDIDIMEATKIAKILHLNLKDKVLERIGDTSS